MQRYARATTWQELVDGRWQAPRVSKLDPFKPHLHQRTEEGCGNAAQLFREIKARGYDGSYSTVRDYLDQHRPENPPLTPPPPTVREVTGWLTRHPDNLTEDVAIQSQLGWGALGGADTGGRRRRLTVYDGSRTCWNR